MPLVHFFVQKRLLWATPIAPPYFSINETVHALFHPLEPAYDVIDRRFVVKTGIDSCTGASRSKLGRSTVLRPTQLWKYSVLRIREGESSLGPK